MADDKKVKDSDKRPGAVAQERAAEGPQAGSTLAQNSDGSETEAGKLAKEDADVSAVAKNDGSVDASGAIQEVGALTAEELDHPAVDNNPRSNTTALQNRADFNDPRLKDEAAVIDKLGLEATDEPLEPVQRVSHMVDGREAQERSRKRHS